LNKTNFEQRKFSPNIFDQKNITTKSIFEQKCIKMPKKIFHQNVSRPEVFFDKKNLCQKKFFELKNRSTKTFSTKKNSTRKKFDQNIFPRKKSDGPKILKMFPEKNFFEKTLGQNNFKILFGGKRISNKKN